MVRELLAQKERWCQGAMARDKNGNRICYDAPEAASFDLFGAILKCYDRSPWIMDVFLSVRLAVFLVYSPDAFGNFLAVNDYEDMTYETIMKIIIRADV